MNIPSTIGYRFEARRIAMVSTAAFASQNPFNFTINCQQPTQYIWAPLVMGGKGRRRPTDGERGCRSGGASWRLVQKFRSS